MEHEIPEHRHLRRKLTSSVQEFVSKGGKVEVIPSLSAEERVERATATTADWMKKDRSRKFGETLV